MSRIYPGLWTACVLGLVWIASPLCESKPIGAVPTTPHLDQHVRSSNDQGYEGVITYVDVPGMALHVEVDGGPMIFAVANDTRVTLDNRPSDLVQLQPGFQVFVTTKTGEPPTAELIEALTVTQ